MCKVVMMWIPVCLENGILWATTLARAGRECSSWYACVETGAPVEAILITSPFVVALLLQYVVDFLATKAKMLQEYFSLEIKVSFISREHH